MLRKVKGIGSKTAIAVLSSIGSEGLLKSLATGDHDALQAVPGIGKKTAARLVVELREQVIGLIDQTAIYSASDSSANGGVENSNRRNDAGIGGASFGGGKGQLGSLSGSIEREGRSINSDVILALEKLGFSRDRARLAVDATLSAQPGILFEQAGELLKQVLLHI